MHAYCLEALSEQLRPGARVLDVGSGSGYLSAVMARLVSDGSEGFDASSDPPMAPTTPPSSPTTPASPTSLCGHVVGIEHVPQLTTLAQSNVRQDPVGRLQIETQVLEFVTGDGRKGWPARAPYDAIHVGASTPLVPRALVAQLKRGGCLIAPVGAAGQGQRMVIIRRDQRGEISMDEGLTVNYVPLTDLERQIYG